MKTAFAAIIAVCLLAGGAWAAGIDGKWYSERKMNRDGNEFVIKTTFVLKSDGGKLTGKITNAVADMEPRESEIQDGKVDGAKFSFMTVMSTPGGDFKTVWSGEVDGDTMKGTATREGGEPRPFEAKRQ